MKTHMVGQYDYRDLCSGKMSSRSHFTRDWGKVTCKLCLRRKKKLQRRPK